MKIIWRLNKIFAMDVFHLNFSAAGISGRYLKWDKTDQSSFSVLKTCYWNNFRRNKWTNLVNNNNNNDKYFCKTVMSNKLNLINNLIFFTKLSSILSLPYQTGCHNNLLIHASWEITILFFHLNITMFYHSKSLTCIEKEESNKSDRNKSLVSCCFSLSSILYFLLNFNYICFTYILSVSKNTNYVLCWMRLNRKIK